MTRGFDHVTRGVDNMIAVAASVNGAAPAADPAWERLNDERTYKVYRRPFSPAAWLPWAFALVCFTLAPLTFAGGHTSDIIGGGGWLLTGLICTMIGPRKSAYRYTTVKPNGMVLACTATLRGAKRAIARDRDVFWHHPVVHTEGKS